MATLRQLASRYDSPLEALSAYHAANRNGDRRAQAELEPLIHAIVEQYPDRGLTHFGVHYLIRGHILITQPAPIVARQATMPRFEEIRASVASESERRPEPDGDEPPANVVEPEEWDDDELWDDDDVIGLPDDSDEHPARPDQAVSLLPYRSDRERFFESRNDFGVPIIRREATA